MPSLSSELSVLIPSTRCPLASVLSALVNPGSTGTTLISGSPSIYVAAASAVILLNSSIVFIRICPNILYTIKKIITQQRVTFLQTLMKVLSNDKYIPRFLISLETSVWLHFQIEVDILFHFFLFFGDLDNK